MPPTGIFGCPADVNPPRIALAAMAGHNTLDVHGALGLTGSEVVTTGERMPGQVQDAFGPQLATVFSRLGVPCHRSGGSGTLMGIG